MSTESPSLPRIPLRVLVWPGGTEIGLEVRRALRDHKEVRLLGAGSRADTHGPFAYRDWIELPDVSEPRWLAALQRTVADCDIDVIFPAHDDTLLALAEARDELGAVVVAPPIETCRITRSKLATYRALKGTVAVPEVYQNDSEIPGYPIFVKPDRGQGSRGARLVRDAHELALARSDGADLAMEFLPGLEFTVDCFSNSSGDLLFAAGRPRSGVRTGITGHSKTGLPQDRFEELASRISQCLSLRGPWFFQVRERSDGELTLLEIGPRVAGTMAVHRVLGVNFPLLGIFDAYGIPVSILRQNLEIEIDRPLANRYRTDITYRTVYCDLDDLLVTGERVNTRIVAFLYQAINNGSRLVLLTRHRFDIDATLARFRLQSVFDAIVHVPEGTDKADFIDDTDGILIDDSYRERLIAHERHGILTFDSSSIEALREDLA